jgi:HD-like signal output (HDOD) protein
MPQMRWLPSPPSIYFNLLQEMRSPNASVDRIGQLIAQDPAVSAKVLQLANSAVFGLQLQVVQPEEAVAYIGLETTMALVLLAHSFSSFEPLRPSLFSAEELWRHSLATGQFARAIAVAENHGGEISAQAFAAGLLHDIGKLLFAANLPQPYAKAVALARDERIPVSQAEKRILGADHAEAGGALLGIWGLPSPVVEAVALHHAPVVTTSQGFTPLTAVHTANFIEHESRANESGVEPALAWDYLAALGLDDRAEEWRRICMEPAIG